MGAEHSAALPLLPSWGEGGQGLLRGKGSSGDKLTWAPVSRPQRTFQHSPEAGQLLPFVPWLSPTSGCSHGPQGLFLGSGLRDF